MKTSKSDKAFITRHVQKCKRRTKEAAPVKKAAFVVIKGTQASIDSLFEPEHKKTTE